MIIASPKFMRAYRASLARFRAESEFDIRPGVSGMRPGAFNRKRKRFVRKAVAKAMKEITQ
jgi:hypothetical protein